MWNIDKQKYIEYHRYDQNTKPNAAYKLKEGVQTTTKQTTNNVCKTQLHYY